MSAARTRGLCAVGAVGALALLECRSIPPRAGARSDASALPSASAAAPAPVTTEPPPRARFARELDATSFKKGNVHTHSNVSDGDSSPETVVRWYRDHGYDFLAMTEHHVLLDPKLLAPLETDTFKLVSGEEITMTGAGKQVHVNGLCIRAAIQGGTYATPRDALDHAIAAVAAQDGVSIINHPNFEWALEVDDVRRSEGATLLEVASGHPFVNTAGACDPGSPCRPSHEALWDAALSAGRDFGPVAVDDAHKFKPPRQSLEARAGRAWIQVFSSEGDATALCAHLRAGELYASTGAEITRFRVHDDRMTVWPRSTDAEVEFVGRGGVVLDLHRVTAEEAGARSYVADGSEGYVRARVREPSGALAYLPAVRVLRHDAPP
ncbi:MAG: hypothetical protein U0414_11000 [Polyangiaceae bacterium]